MYPDMQILEEAIYAGFCNIVKSVNSGNLKSSTKLDWVNSFIVSFPRNVTPTDLPELTKGETFSRRPYSFRIREENLA